MTLNQQMSNRALAGAFDRWAEMAQEAKEMRILIQRCMKKMMNRQLHGAFERWCEMVVEAGPLRGPTPSALGN